MHEPIDNGTPPGGAPAGGLSLVRPVGTPVGKHPVEFLGWSATVLIDGGASGGRSALVETLGTKGASLPWHVHEEDEVIHVVEGGITVHTADGEIPLGAGEAVSLPRGDEHSCVVESDRAKFLSFFTPAGFEEAVSEMEHADGSGTPDLERFVTIAARHGCDVTGPSPGTRPEGFGR